MRCHTYIVGTILTHLECWDRPGSSNQKNKESSTHLTITEQSKVTLQQNFVYMCYLRVSPVGYILDTVSVLTVSASLSSLSLSLVSQWSHLVPLRPQCAASRCHSRPCHTQVTSLLCPCHTMSFS